MEFVSCPWCGPSAAMCVIDLSRQAIERAGIVPDASSLKDDQVLLLSHFADFVGDDKKLLIEIRRQIAGRPPQWQWLAANSLWP